MRKTSFLFASLCIIFALLASCHSFICTEAMYEEFLTHWGRNFTQEKLTSEFTARFNAYCQNRRYVDQINAQNLTYDLDIYWQWMDKFETERKQLVKVEFTPQAIAATAVPIQQIGELRKVSSTIPSYVDYRESGDVSSIKSQGSCGCCWSFTTVGTYESWMMLKGEQEFDLSEQYLLECTTKFTKNVMKQNYESTCNGGYVDFSGELARVNGVPTEEKFPYIAFNYTGAVFPDTPGICDANQTIMYAQNPNVTSFMVARNNTNLRMKQLIASGPVSALIYGDLGFQSYRSGVYSGCPQSFRTSFNNINHAVVIVGYDINGNYIVKNSWGTTWGMDGFGIVDKDRDCGLSAYAFMYVSSAPPGNGVIFNGQTNLNVPSAGYHVLSTLILTVLMLALIN